MDGKSAVVDGNEIESYSNDSDDGFSTDDSWNEPTATSKKIRVLSLSIVTMMLPLYHQIFIGFR